jgi:hypothetical protein
MNQQSQELHDAQNPKHLVVLGKRSAVPQLAVVISPHVSRKRIRDSVDQI